jgi:ABC-type polar amino acid transport system ATPase subunit
VQFMKVLKKSSKPFPCFFGTQKMGRLYTGFAHLANSNLSHLFNDCSKKHLMCFQNFELYPMHRIIVFVMYLVHEVFSRSKIKFV